MEYRIGHNLLENEELILEIKGMFGSPKLKHNDSYLREKSSGSCVYDVKKADGSIVSVSLESRQFDPFPRIEIKGIEIPVGRKLNWFDYLLVALPVLLVFVGGFFGAICGIASATFNARVMRMPKSALARYGLTAVSTGVAAFTWLLLATVFHILLGSPT